MPARPISLADLNGLSRRLIRNCKLQIPNICLKQKDQRLFYADGTDFTQCSSLKHNFAVCVCVFMQPKYIHRWNIKFHVCQLKLIIHFLTHTCTSTPIHHSYISYISLTLTVAEWHWTLNLIQTPPGFKIKQCHNKFELVHYSRVQLCGC